MHSVSDPVSLALWVLNSEKMKREALQEKIDAEETITLSIKTPISVFTSNIPVWVNSKGAIQFGVKSE
jgi:murein L,D-transpeptidase YcbB/YkuD